jgi:hypothetical protein
MRLRRSWPRWRSLLLEFAGLGDVAMEGLGGRMYTYDRAGYLDNHHLFILFTGLLIIQC